MHNGADVPDRTAVSRLTPVIRTARTLRSRRRYRAASCAALVACLARRAGVRPDSIGRRPRQDDPALRFRMPTVTVTAQKEPEDKQKIPVSVTAVSQETIESAGIHIVSEAAIFAPNTFFTEWSAQEAEQRALPRHQLQPEQPGHHDLHRRRAAAERELLEHRAARRRSDRVRARSAERALRPEHARRAGEHHEHAGRRSSKWTGTLSAPFGNHGSWAVRGGASGPVVKDKVSLGVSFAQVNRDGFTVNDVTGNDIDRPLGVLGQGAAAVDTEQRLGRRASSSPASGPATATTRSTTWRRCAPIRFTPPAISKGFANRDVIGTTIQARRAGGPVVFSSTTGFLNWKTQDVTDLDYTPRPVHHARQHGEGLPVHAGDSLRVGGHRAGPA